MVVGGAEDREAVHDFVADEIGVVAADFAVVVVVVVAAALDIGGERGRQFLRLVLGDEVHHVIGDQRGEPADVLARGFQVVGGPDGGGSHDLDVGEVAACFFGPFADETKAPLDQVRIGKLENHAVADTPGGAQRFWAVAGDPDARNLAIGPREFCRDAIEVDGLACV